MNENSKVVMWKISINEIIKDENGNVTSQSEVENLELWNSNFVKISQDYTSSGSYYLNIKGVDENGGVVLTEGPLPMCSGCNTYTEECSIHCNGTDNAWKITKNVSPNGGDAIFQFLQDYDYFDQNLQYSIPYYQYFDGNFVSSPAFQTSNINGYSIWHYYMIQPSDISNPAGSMGKVVSYSNVDAANPFYSSTGDPLSGFVIGIQKRLGPWTDYYPYSYPVVATDPSLDCSNGIQYASSIAQVLNTPSSVVNYDPSYPDIDCGGFSNGESGPGDPESVNFFDNCGYFMSELADSYSTDEDFYDFLTDLNEYCNNDPSTGGILLPNVNEVSISVLADAAIDENDNGVVSLTNDNLFTPEGDFCGPTFNASSGLYSFTFYFVDNSVLSFPLEVKESTTNSMGMSDFLDAVAFPVPITDDKFYMHFTARARVSFTYYL